MGRADTGYLGDIPVVSRGADAFAGSLSGGDRISSDTAASQRRNWTTRLEVCIWLPYLGTSVGVFLTIVSYFLLSLGYREKSELLQGHGYSLAISG